MASTSVDDTNHHVAEGLSRGKRNKRGMTAEMSLGWDRHIMSHGATHMSTMKDPCKGFGSSIRRIDNTREM